MEQPLARALESYVNLDGKRCCRFIGLSVAPPPDIGDDTCLSARPSTSTSVDWESSDPLQPDDSGSVYFDGMAQLPDYPPKASPNFHWSSLDSAAFSQALDLAYLEVAHWRKNCFDVPRGLVGKQFVSELARLFRTVGEGSALESVALKAIFLLASCYYRSHLALQNLKIILVTYNVVCSFGTRVILVGSLRNVVQYRVGLPVFPPLPPIRNWQDYSPT